VWVERMKMRKRRRGMQGWGGRGSGSVLLLTRQVLLFMQRVPTLSFIGDWCTAPAAH